MPPSLVPDRGVQSQQTPMDAMNHPTVAALIQEIAALKARQEEVEASNKLMLGQGPRKTVAEEALEDAKIQAFFAEHAVRPDTELYAIFEAFRPSSTIYLINESPIHDKHGNFLRNHPGLTYQFAAPSHGVGNDLYDRENFTGYRVLMIDWLTHPDVRVTEPCLKWLRESGIRYSSELKPKPGHFSIKEVLTAVSDAFPNGIGGVISSANNQRQIMNGEEFRKWIKPLYEERLIRNRTKRQQISVLQGANPLERLTGQLSKMLLSESETEPAVAAGV